MSDIGGRIIALREMLNLSQIGLARQVGLSATTLSKYEKNLREPRADIIIKLADALQTSSDYLLGRVDDPAPARKDAAWAKLNREEAALLEGFRRLPEREKGRLAERLAVMAEQMKGP